MHCIYTLVIPILIVKEFIMDNNVESSINYTKYGDISIALRTNSTLNYYCQPFANEVRLIYLGYRTCYSKSPSWEDIPVDEQSIAKLKEDLIKDDVEFTAKIEAYRNRFNYPKVIERINPNELFEQIDNNIAASAEAQRIEAYRYLSACRFIAKHLNHESPFEHGVLTFRLNNVSRSLTHQLVRHRIASFSQASQRYIGEDTDNLQFTVPSKILDNKEALQEVHNYFSQMIPVMNRLRELGIRNEDIRCIFPNAMSTSIQVTMNFREIKHLLELRLDSHAQDEIREMSYALLCMLSAHMPFIWNHSSILK